MHDILISNSGKIEVIMKDAMSFKNENGVFYIRGRNGVEKAVRGRVSEINGSKIIIEGTTSRTIISSLAPLNF